MSTRLQRRIAALAAAASLMAGCGSGYTSSAENKTLESQLLTMDALADDRVTITIRAEYNVNNEVIRKALQEKFPDTNIVMVFHCSQKTQYELRQSLQGGTAEDIIISPNMKQAADLAPDTMIDLSQEDYVERYKGESLADSTVNGKVYYLPGPSSIYGIVYDRTLFAAQGWEIPHSYDEFLSLVSAIDAAGIRAFQPSCKYARQAQMVFTMFNYDATFSGTDHYNWLLGYQSGQNSMAGFMEPALERYLQLQQADVIRADDFDVQPGNRSKMIYTDHSAAMIIETQSAEEYASQAGSDHEYGMMPFWSGNEENSDYVMSIPSYYIGLNRSLESKENSAKLKKAKEILSYISTPEGQLAVSGGTMKQISNVEDTAFPDTAFLKEVRSTILAGRAVPEIDLMASGNNNAAELALQKDLRSLLEGTVDAAGLMKDCDDARDSALASGSSADGEVIAKAEQTFSRIETGLFIADALKQKANADIGLCLCGTVHCGMVGQIYQGDISTEDIKSLSLSVGTASADPNDKKLWLVELTGDQLMNLLQEGYQLNPNDNVPNLPYYVASGLKIKFAPLKEDKLESVTLADGSALNPEVTYQVALWGWPFEQPCEGRILKVFDDSCDDILIEALQKQDSVTPSNEDVFTVDLQ